MMALDRPYVAGAGGYCGGPLATYPPGGQIEAQPANGMAMGWLFTIVWAIARRLRLQKNWTPVSWDASIHRLIRVR